MTSPDETTEKYAGVVKWFDPSKGFGFIVAQEAGSDILLHANALRNFGLNSVCDGARITIHAQKTTRGLQTVEVLEVLPPKAKTRLALWAVIWPRRWICPFRWNLRA